MIDIAFLTQTFLRLLSALPVTLGLFFSSFVVGAALSVLLVAMRVSAIWPLSGFARLYMLIFSRDAAADPAISGLLRLGAIQRGA
ncbi:hypothetical protein DZS_15310 [Dickeya ananatis]